MGNNGLDRAISVEFQAVDAHFAVDARLVVKVLLVDAVINDVPLVFAGHLDDRVVGSAVDSMGGVLTEYYGLVSHPYRTQR